MARLGRNDLINMTLCGRASRPRRSPARRGDYNRKSPMIPQENMTFVYLSVAHKSIDN